MDFTLRVYRILLTALHKGGYGFQTFEDFKVNLHRFREVVSVRTVAMHGSPRSRFNNLDIWKRHDYRGLGIIGEPYLDVNFSEVFYLTDTGRRWDGGSVSVRDRV